MPITINMKNKIAGLGELATAYIDEAKEVAIEKFGKDARVGPDLILQIAAIMVALDSTEHHNETRTL
jgi:hypothetical protein